MGDYVEDGLTAEEVMQETGGKPVKPLARIRMANLGGKTQRRLNRKNTVHLKGICPKCEQVGIKFHKYIPLKNGEADHNKWVCPKCNGRFAREELKYVKYC